MSEINIKVVELSEAIKKLAEIKAQCESGNVQIPKTIGGGNTVNEMESLANLYQEMNKHISTLITSTSLFFIKTKQGFEENDKNAALQLDKWTITVKK